MFEHDGAPFTSIELAALLSGGSSKEFESELTTGRFGTGFLVTHVLSERTVVRGLLQVQSNYEQFDLVLDRGGDEDAILANIKFCNGAIENAEKVCELDPVPSARFEYEITDRTTRNVGIGALRQALPYLYMTRQTLGKVVLETEEEGVEVWTAGEVLTDTHDERTVEYRSLLVERNATMAPEFRVFRFTVGSTAALILVEKAEEGWKVQPPEPNAPRVYREYPLRGSGFLSISFVLDGKFDPDQERSRLLMGDEDKRLLQDSLTACVCGVKYAFDEKWKRAHLLAEVTRPGTGFDPTDASEKEWWTKQLGGFAQQLAELPIVECTSAFLPAIVKEGQFADFALPRLLPTSAGDETTVDRIWPLIDSATDLLPPRKELASDWTAIAEGWHALGLSINRVSLNKLADSVRGDAKNLDELKVRGDAKNWLARFLDVVGECWSNRAGVDLSVLAGILPNQNRRLCSPKELSRDSSISEQLKNVCAEMGYDVRNQLLLGGFEEIAGIHRLTHLPNTLVNAVEKSLSENDVVSEAIKHLGNEFPEDEDCDEASSKQQEASVRLLHYLWTKSGKDAAPIARTVPLITSKNRAVRWSRDRLMMAPALSWGESARPFADAYPPHRVLADLYAGKNDETFPDIVPELVEWGIALADPITTDTPAELKERRLSAISGADSEGVVITSEKFSQIALLQPEVLNRCQEGVQEARALLGLVLCHVAKNDSEWKQERLAKGRRGGKDVVVPVYGALWLADLKFRAWVPMLGDENKLVKMPANAATLKNLLDPKWLEANDAAIRLLSQWFEFDELELRLLGIAPDPQKRQELRNELAKLVESAGDDPQLYSSLAKEIEARRRRNRDIERCKRFGLAIQGAIKSAMENYGLRLKLVDRGFDFEVSLPIDGVLDDAAIRLEVGPYLLEVKATTQGGARLTPTQASTAAKESFRYVLCVVDLRNVSEEELDAEWTPDKVEPLASIVPQIGDKVERTCLLIEEAKSSSVAIRNDSALRYEVPVRVWEAGISISEWVAEISEDVKRSGE
ncbi:MAG TPA: hypothetical protein VMI10_25830 [Terriglobales bacterium]|nr:hypothetical protein [Terriglobales bacterium]